MIDLALLLVLAFGSLWACRWLADGDARRARRSRKRQGEERLRWR